MTRSLLTLAAFVAASLSPLAYADFVPVQIVHNSGRNPRPIFQAAKQAFDDVGIRVRLVRTIRRNLPPRERVGVWSFYDYRNTWFRYYTPKLRTIVMPRPITHNVRGGVASICGYWGISTWDDDPVESAVILAHELGHLLGAQHEQGDNVMTPYLIGQQLVFWPRAVSEMRRCLRNERGR